MSAPPPTALQRRWGRWIAAGLTAAMVLALAASAGLLAGLLTTETGARALLARLPSLVVVQPQGRLLGGDFQAQRIELTLRPGRTLVIDAPRWRNATLHWQGNAPWHLRLHIAQADAQRVRIEDTGPAPAASPVVPLTSLALPLGLDIDSVQVAELQGPDPHGPGVRELRFGLHLGAGSEAEHRLSALSLQWNRLQASGSAQVGAHGPLPLTAQLRLAPLPNLPGPANAGALQLPADWTAVIDASGTLDRVALQATVRAHQQALDATAVGLPFAAQPVSQLQVQARGFDIAPFVRDAPFTALTGELRVQLGPKSGSVQTLDVTAALRNERPTRWGEGGVPVRRLTLALNLADAASPAHGRVSALQVDLGSAGQAAGSVGASGQWDLTAGSGALQVDGQATLNDVLPAQLDPRAPALQASGPLQWRLHWPGGGAGPVLQKIEASLQGRALALRNAPPLRLDLSASGQASAWTVTRLEARAGTARATLSGHARRQAGARWQLAAKASLSAFDPLLWWPGPAAAPWRRGPNQLNGELHLDLELPAHAGTRPVDTLAAARGQADLSLRASQVAGVPVSGSAMLRAPGTGPVTAALQLRSGSSECKLDAQLDPRGNGAADRWQLEWQSTALQTLAPLLRAVQGGAAVQLPSGDSAGTLSMQGRWPQASLRGETRSRQLALGDASLQQAGARWTLEGGAAGVVDVQVQVERLQIKGQRPALQALTLRAQGSAAAHKVQFGGDITGLALPANAPAGLAARVPRSLHAALQAEGAWKPGEPLCARGAGTGCSARSAATGASVWTGSVQQLELRDPDPGAAMPLWLGLSATPLQVSLGGPAPSPQLQVQVGETRLRVADATLHVERVQWQRNAAGAALLDLHAALEPLALAPLLARLQPDFGWSGDLRMAGRVDLQSDAAGQVQADVSLGRSDGDLLVLEPDSPDGPQRLGLSDARMSLQVRQGQWQLQQHLMGRNLGTLEGDVSLQTAPTAWWPGAQVPLAGRIDLRVANLGAWGLWLPAGWRLSGELATQARVGGRVGAPQFTGELTGQHIGVHNPVQGVDWREASLRIALQGASARIESFTAQAGGGTLSGSGDVVLDEVPRVQLKLSAQKFAALQRVDRRVVISGSTDLSLEPHAVALTGRVRVDEGRIDISQADTPSLDDDVSVRRGPAGGAAAPGKRPLREVERRIAVDLKLDLGPALRLRGRGVDTLLAGELQITSPANRLAVHGTIRAADGTYDAYAQKLNIDRGLVIFTGTPDNPRLDIEATRPNTDDVRVGVAITGTAQNPRVRLFSEPEMSDTDKLSWLVLGRPSDGLGRTDLALLQRAAYALLKGESNSPSVLDRIGLDEMSVRQNDNATVRETVVSLGKQLSRRWYVGYERSLNAVAGTWQLVYRAAQRFTLRAQSGAQNSLDLIWTWHWD